MQIEIYNPKTENDYIKAIDFNYEQLKEQLIINLEKYNSLIVTEDAIKNANTSKSTR